MEHNDFDDFMIYKMITEDDHSGGGSGGGSGCGSGCFTTILAIVVIVLILAAIGGAISSCDSKNKYKSSSSYRQTSSYSGYSNNSSKNNSSTKTTTSQTYGTASPPVEGSYMSEPLRKQSSWQGTETLKSGVKTTKYNYRTKNSSYTFWVNSSGKIVKVSETIYGSQSTSSGSSKKKKKTSTESTSKKSSEYDADDFAHAEDFYDWYRDDFVDYEEAEDYWEEHAD